MSSFRRSLSDELIDRLNSEYERAESWWRALVDHEKTFVAVRKGEVNVYVGGGSIARISLKAGRLSCLAHAEFLTLLDNDSRYVDLASPDGGNVARPVVSNFEDFYRNLGRIIRRVPKFHGKERRGEISIAAENDCVVDVEATFDTSECESDEDEAEDNQSGRIDLVALSMEGTLRFIEAKLFENPELRAIETPAVCGQLATYHLWIRENRELIGTQYATAFKQCGRLLGTSFNRFRNVPSQLTVDPIPRLLIFSFGRLLQAEAKRLGEMIADRCQSDISGFTRDHVASVGGASNVRRIHLGC